MKILDYYINRNFDSQWSEMYRSTAGNKRGKTYAYINTNFRTLYSFIDIYTKFLNYNNLDRQYWAVGTHGQELAKQWVVNMTQSKLFQKKERRYILTAKGVVFGEMINADFTQEEQWVLLFLFLQNGYFSLKPNYVNRKSSEVLSKLLSAGFGETYLISSLKDVLRKPQMSTADLFSFDIFWLLSFCDDADFLSIFKDSSSSEKKDLFDYVSKEYRNKSYDDIISYKFKSSGQYSKNTFIDDAKTLLASVSILKQKPLNLTDYLSYLFKAFDGIYVLDKKKIFEFIDKHEDVFQVIFKETFGDIEEDLKTEIDNDIISNLQSGESLTVRTEKIDDTSIYNSHKISQISSVLKRMCKDRTNYHCQLHVLNGCRYFTSKENSKNYLEVHHLIPREFSNEFENSIEIIDNYVPLCPHCHRLLHFGTDRERTAVLRYLFNLRKDKLKENGLDVDIDTLMKYYDIEE